MYRVRLVRRVPQSWRAVLGKWADDPGGVFVADDPDDEYGFDYDPVKHVDELLTRACVVDADDDSQLLAFVNDWGLFDLVAREEQPHLLYLDWKARPKPPNVHAWDSVSLMQGELRDIQRLTKWLAAMKKGHWRSRDLPSQGTYFPEGKPDRTTWWLNFAFELNDKLRPVVPMLGIPDQPPPTEQLFPFFVTGSPADAIYLTLRDRASDVGTTARFCRSCRGVFFISVTNGKRVYCSQRCKNRFNVAKHRRKHHRP